MKCTLCGKSLSTTGKQKELPLIGKVGPECYSRFSAIAHILSEKSMEIDSKSITNREYVKDLITWLKGQGLNFGYNQYPEQVLIEVEGKTIRTPAYRLVFKGTFRKGKKAVELCQKM